MEGSEGIENHINIVLIYEIINKQIKSLQYMREREKLHLVAPWNIKSGVLRVEKKVPHYTNPDALPTLI